jgi:hypothetical protein
MAEADLGPVKDLAKLAGAKDDDVLRYFILVVAMLVDRPALLAATGGETVVAGERPGGPDTCIRQLDEKATSKAADQSQR